MTGERKTELDKDALEKACQAYEASPCMDLMGPMEAAILAYLTALPQSALSSRLVEDASWRCFHCGEVFTTEDDARTHFGGSETDEPGCTLNLLEGGLLKLYREAEDELRRYRQEDHEASRTFYALGSDHARALMREEEKGYERGLRDGREAAAALGGIPEGWKLVPIEPTEAMLHAGRLQTGESYEMLAESNQLIAKWHRLYTTLTQGVLRILDDYKDEWCFAPASELQCRSRFVRRLTDLLESMEPSDDTNPWSNHEDAEKLDNLSPAAPPLTPGEQK